MQFDVVISGVQIFDGSGRAPYKNDIGIRDGRVVSIGQLGEAEAARLIDGKNLAVCPGFIDIHSHADMTAIRPDHPDLLRPLLEQGITTFVGGNCGVAMAPISRDNPDTQMKFYDFFLGEPQDDRISWQNFGEMLDVYENQGMALNMGMLAPHSILRMDVLDISTKRAEPPHMETMKRTLAECMEAGALGMSTGLQYPAGLSSDQWELTELARIVHNYNGVFTSHLRSYSSNSLLDAIEEVISVGRDADVPVQISHLFWIPNFRKPLNTLMKNFVKAASFAYNKKEFPLPVDSALKPALSRIDELVKQGVPIGADAMPTSAGFTHVLALFPPWALEGGMDRVRARLADPAERKKIRHSIENGDTKWPHRGQDSWSMNLFKTMGWDCAFIMSVKSDKNQHLVGRNFVQIGEERGQHPFDAVCDLLLEENGRVLIFETLTFPGDSLVEHSLLQPLLDRNVSIVTDTILLGFGLPSHLFYDCYPKFLGQYSREWGMLPMAEAIRKCTSLPAKQLQLRNRGEVKEGYWADLVVFDPLTIGSRSTPQDPKHYPAGVHYVLVNGRVVKDPDGYHPEPRAGRLIRRGQI
jgi:N-acyl-D-amino-acid deacylase